ncbi:MAG: HAD-IIB family hydrolase [Clostridia bacterium]|nr:HAD-IIB family hydrolase [Clostridia bacterium]
MKFIASDFDGTIHYRDGIAQNVRDALAYWQSLGNKFGIVSGRGIKNLTYCVNYENLKCDFLVANNGAVIADGEGKPLKVHTGNPDCILDVATFILQYDCRYVCVNDLGEEIFICTKERKESRYKDDDRFVILEEYDQIKPFTQLSTVCRDVALAEELTDLINEKFAGKVTALRNGYCIDIVPHGVNKATGVEDLLLVFGGSHDDVATVGDNSNDYDMIKAFRSYAVANAIDSIKEIATHVVTDLAELVEKELER